ncbi:ABC transporter ATP-binding protein [Zoogloea sp.]|uniref:ABC transporter ATP-binding protein n=1 Tax=Zoogloea sp. TaxID=49181 RepID=UPI0035B14E66
MIELKDVSKTYETRSGAHTVLCRVNLKIYPGEKVGVLGRNGAGKSTLIRILSGAEKPSFGTLVSSMRVSWPLAFGGAFQGGLTGMDNVRFVSRVYGVNPSLVAEYVKDFSQLGRYLNEPVKSYSTGMRARLAFALSMAVDFDCYLIDEIVAVGDRRFHDKCHEELFVKRKEKSMVIVSHDSRYIREHCDRACVLINGRLESFLSVDEAYQVFEREMT